MVRLIKKTHDELQIKDTLSEYEMFIDMLDTYKDQNQGKMSYALQLDNDKQTWLTGNLRLEHINKVLVQFA